MELLDFRLRLAWACALVGSGGAVVGYLGTHDEPWWWLKALISGAACAALSAAAVATWRVSRR